MEIKSYKIRNKKTGKFVSSGFKDSKNGKTWSNLGFVKNAFRMKMLYTRLNNDDAMNLFLDEYEILELIFTESSSRVMNIKFNNQHLEIQ